MGCVTDAAKKESGMPGMAEAQQVHPISTLRASQGLGKAIEFSQMI